MVAASHDQPWWPPLTINLVSKNGGRLSRSTMVAASHDQLINLGGRLSQSIYGGRLSRPTYGGRLSRPTDQLRWPPLAINLSN